MLEDRRHSSRHPALIRTVITAGRERLDVVCTDTSPTGAFFTTRNPPPVGTDVVVELRAGGVDSPIVTLYGAVMRTTLMGSPGPTGFGVLWATAQCELGPEPLFRVLRQVLHIAFLGDADLTQGRSAEYVFRSGGDPRAAEIQRASVSGVQPLSTTTRPSTNQARGVWSPPMHHVAGTMTRESQAPDTARQPAQHPVELEPQGASSRMHPAPQGARGPSGVGAASLTSGGTSSPQDRAGARTPSSVLHSDRSQMFDGLQDGPSMAVGRRGEHSAQSSENVSQSWPVYALAPGERRQVSDPLVAPADQPHHPVVAPTAHRASGATAQESISAREMQPSGAVSRHPIVAPPAQPTSQPFDATLDRTDPVQREPSNPRRKPEGARMLLGADVPVTFLRQEQFVPGHLIGIAAQLACVVTQSEAPGLDEVLVIHLPVRVANAWRTLLLTGKLLQVATDTAQGKRFVMHIERVDEGRHRGAFATFLQALAGP